MFGERLKDLRVQKGYSMDKLVELYNSKYDAKMNKSTLSRYENGIQEPIYTVVVNFANFFGVSVDYLSGGQGDNYEDELIKHLKEDTVSDIFVRLRQDATFYDAVQKLYNLNEAQLSAVITMLSTFEQN